MYYSDKPEMVRVDIFRLHGDGKYLKWVETVAIEWDNYDTIDKDGKTE